MKVYLNNQKTCDEQGNPVPPRIIVDVKFIRYLGDSKNKMLVELPDGNQIVRRMDRDVVPMTPVGIALAGQITC